MTGEADDSNLALAFARADRIAPILANSPIIHGNPVIVKRLLNVVKMRSQIAKRRAMPLDEAIITKLVIFERCVGVDGTADLYHLVDIEQGVPRYLNSLTIMAVKYLLMHQRHGLIVQRLNLSSVNGPNLNLVLVGLT